MQYLEYRRDNYLVSTDPQKLDLPVIHGFLKDTYWAKGISFETVEKSIRNSLAFGLYHHGNQVGFARVITDYARIAYLADVFILGPYRGQGLSTWLLSCVFEHPELQHLHKWILVTRDAHGLYEKFGFRTLKHPETYMEII